MSPVGFKPIILASERPQTHVSDSAAIGIGFPKLTFRRVFKTVLNISDVIHRSYINLSLVSRTDILGENLFYHKIFESMICTSQKIVD